jgi:cytoskeletal protein CcmA (bactofilin family)
MFGKKMKDAGITLIANNCELVGDIHFKDQLLINGCVKGNIFAEVGSNAQVTVSENGAVHGNISAPNVVVNGKVFGDIRSDKHVELAVNAQVEGNVFYSLVEMVEGSRLDGSLVYANPGNTGVKSRAAAESSVAEGQVVPRQHGILDKPATMPSSIPGPSIAGGVQTKTA